MQQDNDNWIDARDLWNELGVKSDYSHWINQHIEDLDLEENSDYKLDSFSKTNQKSYGGDRKSLLYTVKVSTSKEIAMIAGVKGGRTSKKIISAHNKKLSNLFNI